MKKRKSTLSDSGGAGTARKAQCGEGKGVCGARGGAVKKEGAQLEQLPKKQEQAMEEAMFLASISSGEHLRSKQHKKQVQVMRGGAHLQAQPHTKQVQAMRGWHSLWSCTCQCQRVDTA